MSTDPTTTEAADTLRDLQRGTSLQVALAFFDGCAPVEVDQVLGSWRGSELPTGNAMDGLLTRAGWVGKEFRAADDVDPLVFGDDRGAFAVNPALVPLGLTLRFQRTLGRPGVTRTVKPLLRLLRTRRPAARLRMVEHRGVATATMVYDALAINDHFRRVDQHTLIGCMDMRVLPEPYLFVLRREGR